MDINNDFLSDSYDLLGKNPSRKCKKSQSKPEENVTAKKRVPIQNDNLYILRDESL